MSKTASIVLVCILSVLIIFTGVFCFVTDLPFGDYKVYYAPSDIIQLGSEFTDTEVARYTIDTTDFTDEEIATLSEDITSVINSRLGVLYGYYNADIVVNDDVDRMTITIPTTTADEETSAKTLLTSIVATGLVEIISYDSSEYSADDVLMVDDADEPLFKSASTSTYISGSDTYYIVEVKLTSTGLSTANDVLYHSSSSASGIVAIDGEMAYYVYHTSASNTMTIYTASSDAAETLAAYINHGALATDLTLIDTTTVVNESMALTIVVIAFAVLVLAILALFVIKYGVVGLAGVMSTLIVGIVCILFAGLATFAVFNLYAVIGFVLGLAILAYCLVIQQNAFVANSHKSTVTAMVMSFKATWLRIVLVCCIALVVGIILWVIPCAATVSLGNALVYGAVLSALASLGLQWPLVMIVKPLAGKKS